MTVRASVVSAARRAASRRDTRFVIAGAWNTLFGYLAFLGVYAAAHPRLGATGILCVSYLIALSQSFAIQRAWVFRSQGRVARELPRFVAANSLVFGANLAFLPIAIRVSDIPPPMLQGVFVVVSTVASYFLHKHFSFAHKP